MAEPSRNELRETLVDDTSMQKTPRARRPNDFHKQRRMAAEDCDLFDRNEEASANTFTNTSFLEMLTNFDVSEPPSLHSPSEETFRIESPRWLDEQLEAALDQKRSWRSGFTSPLTPTHDQVFKVPVYSPGQKGPAKLELPEYLELRQEALDMKQKAQLMDENSQLGLAEGQDTECYSPSSESQVKRPDLISRLGPDFEH